MNNSNKSAQWDTRDVLIEVPAGNSWTIPLTFLPVARRILEGIKGAEGQAKPVYIRNDQELTVEGLHALVRLLQGKGLLTGEYYNAGTILQLLQKEFPPESPKGPDEPSPLPSPVFNGKKILVVGTGNERFTQVQRWMANAVGRMLAINGYGLICGGWRGVDEYTAREFVAAISPASSAERMATVVTEYRNAGYQYGTLVTVKGDKTWYDFTIGQAFAVILIGGEGGTYDAYERAKKDRVPVIPIAATGGDAGQVYKELLDTKGYLYQTEMLMSMAFDINGQEQADRTASLILNVLETLVNRRIPNVPMTGDEFESAVTKLYKDTKVVHEDDPQKERWGGQAVVKGVHIKASVVSQKKDDNFAVTLIVEALPTQPKLEGRVAFFVHNSFDEEIYYDVATKGKATLRLIAEKAFTAGAYIENGTMLELDLDKTPGYPADFYNDEAPQRNAPPPPRKKAAKKKPPKKKSPRKK
jgi:hypothetical protein